MRIYKKNEKNLQKATNLKIIFLNAFQHLSNSFSRNCKVMLIPIENFYGKFANMAVSLHPNIHLFTYFTHKVKTCRWIVDLSVVTRREGRKGDVVLLYFLRAFQLSICSLDSNLLFEKMASQQYNVFLMANNKKRAFRKKLRTMGLRQKVLIVSKVAAYLGLQVKGPGNFQGSCFPWALVTVEGPGNFQGSGIP